MLELHGLKYLGDKLHQLSLNGEWQKMREVITDDELLELAQVSTYDKMPEFIRENREYATMMGFGRRADSPEDKERTRALMKELQAIENPGVPRGLEM